MGSNSNRPENQDEKIGRFAKEVINGNSQSEEWQCSKGAEIRGSMGIEKGNEFIKSMNNFKVGT